MFRLESYLLQHPIIRELPHSGVLPLGVLPTSTFKTAEDALVHPEESVHLNKVGPQQNLFHQSLVDLAGGISHTSLILASSIHLQGGAFEGHSLQAQAHDYHRTPDCFAYILLHTWGSGKI